MSGSAASLLDFGMTLHGAAHLNTCYKNITQEEMDMWKNTKLLIIDEVSFMNESDIKNLNKNTFLVQKHEN